MIHKCSECKKDYNDGWGNINVVEYRRLCKACLSKLINADESYFLDGSQDFVKSEFERAFGKVHK